MAAGLRPEPLEELAITDPLAGFSGREKEINKKGEGRVGRGGERRKEGKKRGGKGGERSERKEGKGSPHSDF